MLRVPRVRQPDPSACLPACVWAVLQFEGYAVEYDEVLTACRPDERGAVLDLAMQGLQEAGWDVEFVGDFDVDRIRTAIAEGRPLIASLVRRGTERQRLAHAVVICDASREELTVMDPLLGDYRTLSLDVTESILEVLFFEGFFIAGSHVH